MNRKWTENEIEILKDCYDKSLPIKEIAKLLNRTDSAVISKAQTLNIESKSKFSNKYKAIYQDYDWLLEQVLLGKSNKDIAEELGVTTRVIEKWVNEKYHIVFRKEYKLSDLQRQIVIWGTLGDGHIDRRETQPMYIESHAITEKDYLFWKYNKLKNIFNNPPIFYNGQDRQFEKDGKVYHCKDYYRMCSRVVYDLDTIRQMTKIEKIQTIDELGFSLYMLDDASRNNYSWELCVAMLTEEEKQLFLKLCKERFDINGKVRLYDNRYISFDTKSSRKIDDIILSIFPKDMDIIQKKIVNHRKDLQ